MGDLIETVKLMKSEQKLWVTELIRSEIQDSHSSQPGTSCSM